MSDSGTAVQVDAHAEGCTFMAHVKPGARREAVVGVRAGALDVAVHAQPEKGKANKAVAALIAKALGLRKSQVRIVSGQTSRDKRVRLQGVTADQGARLIADIV